VPGAARIAPSASPSLHRPCCTIRRPSSRSLGHSFARTASLQSARTTAYVLYAIVFRETSVGHTRARTLFALLPRDLAPSLAPLPPPTAAPQRPPSSSSRNSTGVTLHLAPVSLSRWQLPATLRPNSRRYRLPLSLPFFASILSGPPSFYSLRVRSRVKKNTRNGPSIQLNDAVAREYFIMLLDDRTKCDRSTVRAVAFSVAKISAA